MDSKNEGRLKPLAGSHKIMHVGREEADANMASTPSDLPSQRQRLSGNKKGGKCGHPNQKKKRSRTWTSSQLLSGCPPPPFFRPTVQECCHGLLGQAFCLLLPAHLS